jgi:hypothetical protein
VESSCEQSNVHSVSIKCEQFLYHVRNYWLVMDDSVALNEPLNLLSYGVPNRD